MSTLAPSNQNGCIQRQRQRYRVLSLSKIILSVFFIMLMFTTVVAAEDVIVVRNTGHSNFWLNHLNIRASVKPGEEFVKTNLVEGLVIFLVLFSLIIRFVLHRLETWIAKHHIHLQTVLRNLYRELMVLGLVSFLFVVYETLGHPDAETVRSFEFSHLLLFMLAVFYTVVVLISSFTSLRLSSRWKKMEEMEFVKYLQCKDEFRSMTNRRNRHEGFYWYWFGWWFPKFQYLYRYKNLHEIMAFHDLRYQFLFYRQLPTDFNFSAYLRKIKSYTFIDLVEAHWTLWFVLLIVVSLDMARRAVWDDNNFALIFVLSTTVLLSLASLCLEIKIRRIHWKLARNPATYFDDHSAPDRKDDEDPTSFSRRRSISHSLSRSRSRSRRTSKVRRRPQRSPPLAEDATDGTLADDEATDRGLAGRQQEEERKVTISPEQHTVIDLEIMESLELKPNLPSSSQSPKSRRSEESAPSGTILRQSGDRKRIVKDATFDGPRRESAESRGSHRILSLYTGDKTGGIRHPPKVVAVSPGAEGHAIELQEGLEPVAEDQTVRVNETRQPDDLSGFFNEVQATTPRLSSPRLSSPRLSSPRPGASPHGVAGGGSGSLSLFLPRSPKISDSTMPRPSVELAAQTPITELHGRHAHEDPKNNTNVIEDVCGGTTIHYDRKSAEKVRDARLGRKNTGIITRVRKQREAEMASPKRKYPSWILKIFPRLGRVASPAEKLFWFGSHHFFLWCVEFTFFISTVVLAVVSAGIASKFRRDLAPNESRVSRLEIADIVLAVINLIHVLYRTAHTLKYYIFSLNNACLVPELLAIQAIDTVKFKARLRFTEYASEGDTTESDTEAARETRRKFWRVFNADSVHSGTTREDGERRDSLSLARRFLRKGRKGRRQRTSWDAATGDDSNVLTGKSADEFVDFPNGTANNINGIAHTQLVENEELVNNESVEHDASYVTNSRGIENNQVNSNQID